jgi:protein-S-isoprenylcysteine O-methyltransferase Ste14
MQRVYFVGFVIVLALRILAESQIKPRDAEPRPSRSGWISLQLLSVPFLLSATAVGFLLWRDGCAQPVLYGLGLVSCAAGFAGRAFALRRLGRSYSLYLDPPPTQPLQTRGLYARVRHPIYAFYLLETLALTLIRPNRISLVCFVAIALTTAWRIDREERALLVRYGAEYRAYMNQTKRFLPWIW